MRKRMLAACAIALGCAAHAEAATYYVSLAGHDGNSGLSSSAPWRSFGPVNALRLQPGDRILLRGGDLFDGALGFDAADAGTASAPIEIGSYGTGRATIRTAAGAGVLVHNASGYRISNLNIVSAGSTDSGIVFYADAAGGVKLPFIRIESVDVRGFGRDGVEIGSWNGATGFRDVRLTGVKAHGNARTGIIFYAQTPNVHENVYVGYSQAFDNPGIPSATSNTGNGIVLGGVNGGTVERSLAWGNGRLSQAGGPVGIWAYDSTRVVLQHNESFDNRTSGTADGGGFDLDRNVTNSVMQYNYSHGNDGSGYLLANSVAGDSHRSNIIRFNISESDGRRNGYAAIEVWGRIVDTEIHNNTVFVAPAASGAPRALRLHNATIESQDVARLKIRNNIFQTRGGLTLVEVAASQLDGATGLRFEGNTYHAMDGGFVIRWGSAVYSGLQAWRATGQEMRSGTATGLSADPWLAAPGSGGTIGDPAALETLTAYRLRDGSTAADAGLDLQALDGLSMGGRDFSGAVVPQGPGYPAGAHELSPIISSPAEIILRASTAAITAGWNRVTDASAAGGVRLSNPNGGAAKLTTALAQPSQFFELTFDPEPGRPYRLWIRGRADGDHWGNDSVFVQFSGSVAASGAPVWRIGTTESVAVNLEDCSGCGIAGWGWQDNGWGVGVLGPPVYFAGESPQTLRVQTREDGFSIDQIVLSPNLYLTRAPGALKNDTTILGGPSAPPPSASEIVLHAADGAAWSLTGEWQLVADATAARGVSLWQANRGAAKVITPLASPGSSAEIGFTAEAGRPYHLWLRMRADGNSWANDSVHVQFSGTVDASGSPTFRIGTATSAEVNLEDCSGCGLSGWGWQDNAWGSLAAPIYFERTGPQRLRIQPREDGVFIDQIVISSGTYLTERPR